MKQNDAIKVNNNAIQINNNPVQINNSAIQILNKPTGVSLGEQQVDDYIGFVPPEYQKEDYSYHQNYNSSLYQPVQEQPIARTESEHYRQIWDEYKTSVGSGPRYTSHSGYVAQTQAYPAPYPPPYGGPAYPYEHNGAQGYPGYSAPPLSHQLPPPPPSTTYPPPPEQPKKSRWSRL